MNSPSVNWPQRLTFNLSKCRKYQWHGSISNTGAVSMSCTTQDQGISRIIALWHDQTVRQVQRTGVKRISESGEPSSMESHPTKQQLGFPGGSDGEESGCNAGDLDSIPGLGRFPGGGHSNLLQYSCLENSHGQRSLEGDSPWGCKELDTTDWLSTQNSNSCGLSVQS